ncbi:MAG: hypothetical protein CMF42_02735 [Legionellales bacterium]|nr:hypothetical protein [Legionellales bacterium]
MLIVLLSFFAPAFAVDYTTVLTPPHPDQDLSYYFLTMIFGQVGNIFPTSIPSAITSPLMEQIFTVYNYAFLTLSCGLIFYNLTLNIINDIASEQPLANQYDVMTISRVVIGNGILFPSYNGYSFIQVIFMQVVYMGVALADNIWVNVIKEMPSSGSITTTSNTDTAGLMQVPLLYSKSLGVDYAADNPYATVANIFAMTVCAYAEYYNEYLTNPTVAEYSYEWHCNSDGSACGAGARTVDENGNLLTADCGIIVPPDNSACYSQCPQGQDYQQCSKQCENNQQNLTYDFSSSVLYGMYFNVVKPMFTNALNNMKNSGYVQILNCPPGGADNCNIGQQLGQLTYDYYNILKPLATITTTGTDDYSTSSESTYETNSQQQGWLSAGAYFLGMIGDLTSSSSTTSSQITQSSLENSMFTVTSFIPNYSANQTPVTSPITIYQYIAQIKSGSNYTWQVITDNIYLVDAANYIANQYADVAPGTPSCGSDNNNPYLDQAISVLYNVWLKNDASNGGFVDLNLGIKSSLNGVGMGFGDVEIGVYQQNFYVLLNRVLEDITGFKYFSNDSSQSYSSVTYNGNLQPILGDNCGSMSNPAGCFCALINNPDSILTSGAGFIGMIVSTYNQQPVNPISSTQYMGMQLLRHALDNITQTITDVVDLNTTLALSYLGQMLIFVELYLPFYIPMGFIMQFVPIGPYIQGVNDIVNSGLKIVTFFQSLDYVYVSLYQGLASTFASIIATMGFLIGVYVAAIPTLYYFLGVISWFLSVIEGMIAMPLVALAITTTKGHNLLGNAESSIVLFLKAFVTPAILLGGLLGGVLLSGVMLDLLNQSMVAFITVFATSFMSMSSSSYSSTLLISTGLFTIFYAYIIATILGNSYSIMFRLVDRCIQYVGGQPENSGLEELAKQARADIAGAGRETAGSAAQTAGNIGDFQTSQPQLGRQDKAEESEGE